MKCSMFATAAMSLAALFGISGCSFADTQCTQHVVTSTPRSERPKDVRLVKHGQQLDEPFEEIAIVRAYGSGATGTEAALLEALRERARNLGADGLVEVRYQYLSGHDGGYEGESPFITAVAVHFAPRASGEKQAATPTSR